MVLIGYARVSTDKQELAGQVERLKQYGCTDEYIFSDIASGSRSDRPGFQRLLSHLRPGDELVSVKLDRIARSLKHLIEIGVLLESKRVDLRIIDQGIETKTPAGRLLFHLLGAIAQFERELIVERTQHGLAYARSQGKLGGRPKSLSWKEKEELKRLYARRELTIEQLCKMFAISASTLYRYVEVEKNDES